MPGATLVGRSAEFARLEQAVSAAVTGSGSLILVTGEAGIGKTTLVESALRRAAPGLVAAWGTCREGPGVPGFWPWAEVIRACAEKGLVDGGTTAEQVALGLAGKPQLELGAAESADAASGRFALFDAVAHTLRRVAAKQTLAVVLDDLQWADLGTLRLLRFLAPDVGRARLLVIGAYRDEELAWGDEQSRQVIDGVASKVTTLALPSLDPAEVAQLVADLDGSPPGADVARDIWRRTGGNPFLVQQVARLGSRTTEIPAGARDAVSRRLAHLSEACVDLLKVAAVVGAQFDSAVLVGAAASSAEGMSAALSEAEAARVLERIERGRYRFTHDLFRETLYRDLDPPVRAAMHARVAEALEASAPQTIPGLLTDLARHHVAAAEIGDPSEALPYVRRAADDALTRMAYEEAASHLRDAVRLVELTGDEEGRLPLLLEQADSHLRAGDLEQARECFVRAADQALAGGDVDSLARSALGRHEVGETTWSSHSEAIGLLESALSVRGQPEDATTARLLAALSRELAHGPGDLEGAGTLSDRAVAMARRLNDPATLAVCLLAKHDALWVPGSARQRLEVLDEMARAADAVADRSLSWQALFGRFVALLELADPDLYVMFLRVADAAERLAQPHYRWVALSRRATLALTAGRLDEAADLIEQVREGAERMDEPDGDNVVADLVITLASMRGELAGAVEDHVGRDIQLAPTMSAAIEALASIERGDPETALSLIRPLVPVGLASAHGWQRLGAVATFADVASRAGDTELASMAYDWLLPWDGELVVTGGAIHVSGPVSLYLGGCARVLGRYDAAMRHLASAVATAHRLGARPWVARAEYEIAQLFLDPGSHEDPRRADELLDSVVRAASTMGMRGLLRDAEGLREQVPSTDNVFSREADG